MSAPESLSPAFSCTPPLLGVRGAKMYLQVKVGGGASRIPAVTQVPESQVTPPENRMVGSSNLRATFTKSSPPETKEVELKQGTGALAEPLIASRPVGKRGAPRGIGRGRAKNHGRGKSTAAEGRPTKTESSVGTRKKVARGNRGVTVGRRELQKILQSRKRQLYLSRKYGVIWGRKVFGRVLPSAARRHHTHQLKRRSIGAWSQVWWSARREWKLNIRADCHNRYRLWMLVWKYWTEFVRGRKQRRAIKQLAICHNERRVVKRVWGGWSEYLRGKRERLESRETAQQWHLAVTLRRGWMRWRESLERKKGRDIMLAAALQHWATRLQSQVWVHWVEQCRERKTEREKTTAAERHWAARKKATCWTAWTTYIEYRGRKRHMNEVAEKRYSRCVLRRVLTTWQERHERARDLAQFQEQVEERGRRAVARRVIFYWKHYMELVFYKEHLMQIATFHYHTVLKSKAVACLRTYSQRQQLQRRHKTAAERFRRLKVLGNGWRQWLERCEHCEEIKMLPFTRRARQHFRLCSLRQFFPTWKRFVLLRRRRKTQIALADQHFKSTALPKCFVVLRDYCGCPELQERASLPGSEFQTGESALYGLLPVVEDLPRQSGSDAMEKMAVLHCEEVVKRASLGRWRVQTDSRLRQLGLEHSAVVHHRRWLLSSALRQWRDCRRRCAVSVRQFSTAQRHHAHKSIKHVWNAWQEVCTVYIQYIPHCIISEMWHVSLPSMWGDEGRKRQKLHEALSTTTEHCSKER
ncbi:Protein SFI1 homolog [Geodia barretti]|uniref:Protein SFI1 homolog n=1 Tax=Geodia barretti TaxID=519541 RepID=A0AA35QV59_GEOBA|nr:Protein SFI1 homolog [Geodia barretti]